MIVRRPSVDVDASNNFCGIVWSVSTSSISSRFITFSWSRHLTCSFSITTVWFHHTCTFSFSPQNLFFPINPTIHRPLVPFGLISRITWLFIGFLCSTVSLLFQIFRFQFSKSFFLFSYFLVLHSYLLLFTPALVCFLVNQPHYHLYFSFLSFSFLPRDARSASAVLLS